MKILQTITWLGFCLSLFVFSLGVSWKINSTINFAYPLWYQTLAIDEHIEKFAPENKYNKQDFVLVNAEQVSSLFNQILTAINHQGSNLSTISYAIKKDSNKLLLTQDEVIHLQDVSHLIDALFIMWLISLLILIVLSYCMVKRWTVPERSSIYKTLLLLVVTVSILFAFVGFKNIFYYLHTVIFPDNHPWFFYYQDSLMSTMMKAPDLFAALGLQILLFGCSVSYFYYRLLKRYRLKIQSIIK